MAAGLPVITTANCIGPDIIEENKNGYLVPIRDIKKIQGAITMLRNKTNDEFQAMSESARKAALKFSWENHKINIREIFTNRLNS